MVAARSAVPLLADFLQPSVIWHERAVFASPPPRPVTGAILGEGLGFHHDGAEDALRLEMPADGGLGILFDGFAGSYVSISIDLPQHHPGALSAGSVLGMVCDFGETVPEGAWCRLNLREGPSLSRPPGVFRRDGGRLASEFDLSECRGRAIAAGWVDLLLPPAASGRLGIAALDLYLRPLAGF